MAMPLPSFVPTPILHGSTSKTRMSAQPVHQAASKLPASNLLTFLRLVGQLKTTKRTGWVYNNIPHPESISDHMYRMSLLSFIFPTKNRDHLIKLSLAHDLAEAIVGDITPRDQVSKPEKRRRELEAMTHIRDDVLQGSDTGWELYNLWKEYDDGETDDAKLVKEMDRFEMIVQADEYERAHSVDLSEFFESTRGAFTSDVMKNLDETLRREREQRIHKQS